MKFLTAGIVFGILGAACSFSAEISGSRQKSSIESKNEQTEGPFSRRNLLKNTVATAVCTSFLKPSPASARLESVNRPELLPSESGLHVIQIEKFLTNGQARRMDQLLGKLESDTGFRVYLLCQNYPSTPGLAIRDYWNLGKEVRLCSCLSFSYLWMLTAYIRYYFQPGAKGWQIHCPCGWPIWRQVRYHFSAVII